MRAAAAAVGDRRQAKQAFIHAQRAQYRPALSEQVTLPDGQTVLRIQYDAPSPLT